jgi:hypothetical protein
LSFPDAHEEFYGLSGWYSIRRNAKIDSEVALLLADKGHMAAGGHLDN